MLVYTKFQLFFKICIKSFFLLLCEIIKTPFREKPANSSYFVYFLVFHVLNELKK